MERCKDGEWEYVIEVTLAAILTGGVAVAFIGFVVRLNAVEQSFVFTFFQKEKAHGIAKKFERLKCRNYVHLERRSAGPLADCPALRDRAFRPRGNPIARVSSWRPNEGAPSLGTRPGH